MAKKTSKSKRNTKLSGSLVIVESPAKCKTIEKMLGRGFEVKASMGHIIDLPKSRMSIDVDNNFEPKYIVLPAKRKILTALKASVKKKISLYLACDPDREGEAISWHLANVLGKDKIVYRVRFNEITKEAIRGAFDKPGEINMNLVGAQQARRILDRLVGYSLSPLLWKKVAKGLSAGRVQSVALKIIVDREQLIKDFVPEEYWSVEADLKKKDNDQLFKAVLDKKNDEKTDIKNEADVDRILNEIKQHEFIVSDIKISQKKRNAGAPYITSKLQQEAYNRLRFQPTRTMRIAQSLYEGIDLGSGETVGLITYMRTDSTNVSVWAIAEARNYIGNKLGKDYLPENPIVYKTKKSAQAAHEAIRPTSVLREPDKLQHILTREQFELYELIWQKFVSSQTNPAIIQQTTVLINAGGYEFRATGSNILFKGFLQIWGEQDAEEKVNIPHLKKGEKLDLVNLNKEQHFTKPPPRFTDASIIKVLEEEGIGRPSTYAPIIATIVARNYVEREGGSLFPTELGCLVVKLLVQHFGELMETEFTARMESDLDHIEEGERKWVDVLSTFYKGFSKRLNAAQEAMKDVKKIEIKTDEVCPLCKRPVVVKWGRRGRFLSCSGFPECRFAKSISTNVQCPKCGKGQLVSRRAKSGHGRSFYGCTMYPSCDFISNKLPEGEPPKKEPNI